MWSKSFCEVLFERLTPRCQLVSAVLFGPKKGREEIRIITFLIIINELAVQPTYLLSEHSRLAEYAKM